MEDNGEFIIKIDSNEKKNVESPNNQKLTTVDNNSVLLNINKISTEQTVNNILESMGIVGSGHPIICMLHLIFKAISVGLYLFGGLIINSSSLFLIISMFAVLDFWIVKNLSGRFY